MEMSMFSGDLRPRARLDFVIDMVGGGFFFLLFFWLVIAVITAVSK